MPHRCGGHQSSGGKERQQKGAMRGSRRGAGVRKERDRGKRGSKRQERGRKRSRMWAGAGEGAGGVREQD